MHPHVHLSSTVACSRAPLLSRPKAPRASTGVDFGGGCSVKPWAQPLPDHPHFFSLPLILQIATVPRQVLSSAAGPCEVTALCLPAPLPGSHTPRFSHRRGVWRLGGCSAAAGDAGARRGGEGGAGSRCAQRRAGGLTLCARGKGGRVQWQRGWWVKGPRVGVCTKGPAEREELAADALKDVLVGGCVY